MNWQIAGLIITVALFFGGITVGMMKWLINKYVKMQEDKITDLQRQVLDIIRTQQEFQSKLLDTLKNIEIQVSTIKASEDRWTKKENCTDNHRRIEDRLSIQTNAIREEIYLELDILEKRISAQIEKLEKQIENKNNRN